MTELRAGIIPHTECSWLDAGKPFTLWPLPLKFSYKIEQFKITQSSPVFPSVTYRAAKKKKKWFSRLSSGPCEFVFEEMGKDVSTSSYWQAFSCCLTHRQEVTVTWLRYRHLVRLHRGPLMYAASTNTGRVIHIHRERERERGWEQSREKRKCWGFFCGEFQRC